jgi:hypothetical protein
MWDVVMRRGRTFEKVPGSPSFANRDDANDWARDFMSKHPSNYRKGLGAIEVRRSDTVGTDDA